MVDASTKVMRGKKTATLKDVKEGDRVVVHSMKHGDQLMARKSTCRCPRRRSRCRRHRQPSFPDSNEHTARRLAGGLRNRRHMYSATCRR